MQYKDLAEKFNKKFGASPEYTFIAPGRTELVANYFGKSLLVEVNPQEFEEEKDKVLQKIGNKRDEYMNLVRQSGLSSQKDLQNIGLLQEALDVSNKWLGSAGVARIHGGGFAGAIQVYVPSERTESYTKFMEEKYGLGCVTEISISNTGLDSCNVF